MNNYQSLFYWMTVADQAKIFFVIVAVVMSIIGIISLLIALGAFTESYEYKSEREVARRQTARKWVFFSWPFMILFWTLWIFTPTKGDALLIVAGGGAMNYLANDSTAKQIPHELIEFTKLNLQNMAQEAKVSLGIQSQKEKILEEAKGMSTSQLLDRMKVDSNFAKLITNQ